jgi:hypothetical protein
VVLVHSGIAAEAGMTTEPTETASPKINDIATTKLLIRVILETIFSPPF